MAKWRPMFQIENVTLPLPDTYSQSVEDLCDEETGRTLDGIFHKFVISIKSSIPMTWNRLEWRVAAQLANAIDGKNKLHCSYIDVRKPYEMAECDMYVGKREFEPVQFDDDGKVYWSVSFSEIEV